MLSKIMGLFNVRADSVEGNVRRKDGMRRIATPTFAVKGSVHDDGYVTVNVENQYGDVNHQPIHVTDSTHHGGRATVNIQNKHDWDDSLPEPSDAELSDARVKKELEDHYASNVSIDELVIVPAGGERGDKYSFQAHGDRSYFKPLYDNGYDCYDRVEFYGEVHEVGHITVEIEDVYVYTPEKYKTVGDLI